MTLEDKKLLTKDIFGRVLTGLKVDYKGETFTLGYNLYLEGGITAFESYPMEFYLEGIETIKPYLRSMSSMTEEETKYKLSNFFKIIDTKIEGVGHFPTLNSISAIKYVDWLNSRHFDYRGLIEKGLALEAPADMYKTE